MEVYSDLRQCSQSNFSGQMVEEQLNSLFILVNPLSLFGDAAKPQLITGPSFLKCDIPPNKHCRMVSFIGPTGVGKSQTMRYICAPHTRKPSPSARGEEQSWTADLNCYYGVIPRDTNTADDLHFLMIDSEGTGGTSAKLALGAFHDKRRDFVEKYYPSLLYRFSDIICFVCKPVETKNEIVDEAVKYAVAAGTRSPKPHLLFIINKTSDTSLTFVDYDYKKDTENFKNSVGKYQWEKLTKYYENPFVYRLPLWTTAGELAYFHAINQLRTQIHVLVKQVHEKYPLQTREQLFDSLNKCLQDLGAE